MFNFINVFGIPIICVPQWSFIQIKSYEIIFMKRNDAIYLDNTKLRTIIVWSGWDINTECRNGG
eukprot:TRINITY_DN13136_c0_g1_i1.p1 TRINITY_DN13136_c0_g1~~TRINITY_DN13136_c0_g1_i1.p1  ORF type:complete len:64 (+),score=14.37 TRINITY_DN13136_c0_g1_i1:232-423(+)